MSGNGAMGRAMMALLGHATDQRGPGSGPGLVSRCFGRELGSAPPGGGTEADYGVGHEPGGAEVAES